MLFSYTWCLGLPRPAHLQVSLARPLRLHQTARPLVSSPPAPLACSPARQLYPWSLPSPSVRLPAAPARQHHSLSASAALPVCAPQDPPQPPAKLHACCTLPSCRGNKAPDQLAQPLTDPLTHSLTHTRASYLPTLNPSQVSALALDPKPTKREAGQRKHHQAPAGTSAGTSGTPSPPSNLHAVQVGALLRCVCSSQLRLQSLWHDRWPCLCA
jgi:hypothetical protein